MKAETATYDEDQYLIERGFAYMAMVERGNGYNRHANYKGSYAAPSPGIQTIMLYQDGWFAHNTMWTTEACPDPCTAYVQAELAEWGKL